MSGKHVPVRTFGDWQDPAPGFVEADLVAHGYGSGGDDEMLGHFAPMSVASSQPTVIDSDRDVYPVRSTPSRSRRPWGLDVSWAA